ncbi:uncharacterized protein LOC124495948 isoform X2 [Dermatophagoides farinae]|uniref:Uncharacterized protein n=1 Tax=Dermatophagoides farinae TaxID=6954 RepID=A0A922IDI7_DERFA|nr:hypothetical protein DERF_000732 [Dermatophagoides farinae]
MLSTIVYVIMTNLTLDKPEFRITPRPISSMNNGSDRMIGNDDDSSGFKSIPSLQKMKNKRQRSTSLTLSGKKFIKKFISRKSLPFIHDDDDHQMMMHKNRLTTHSNNENICPHTTSGHSMVSKQQRPKLQPLKSVNMDLNNDEHRFENFYDNYDTITSSRIQVNILNKAYKQQKQSERIRFAHEQMNRSNKSSKNSKSDSPDNNSDLELDIDKYLVKNHGMFFVSLAEAKQYESVCNQLLDEIIDDENIKCIVHSLQQKWQKYRQQSSRLIFFYQMFSFMFKRYLQMTICWHQNPCPSHVNVARFKRFALPILQEFMKLVNPNKNMILQVELLAAIESLISHKQEYMVAVADVFDLLLKSPLIESCALLEWSRLEDPHCYSCDSQFQQQSTSMTIMISQSSSNHHRKMAKSKSSSILMINDHKQVKEQQQQPGSARPTIRNLIIKQLEKNGIPLLKKQIRNSIS